MIKLIVNADDFGFSRGVNHGIIDSFLYGIVNSTTMIMNGLGTEHAIQLAKNHPDLRVGIHLVLTSGRPLSEYVPSLVDDNGSFFSLSKLNSIQLSLDEVEKEWTAQIERFISSGLKPTHLDSHHHVHTRRILMPIVKKLSDKYKLPVRRNGSNSIPGVKSFTDISLFDFYGDGVTKDYFAKLSTRLPDDTFAEIMCHPAYLDQELLNGSSYNIKRLTELDILLNADLPANIVLL